MNEALILTPDPYCKVALHGGTFTKRLSCKWLVSCGAVILTGLQLLIPTSQYAAMLIEPLPLTPTFDSEDCVTLL